MITAEQKPMEEIQGMIAPFNQILVLGCGSCVAECAAGGQKETSELASTLRMADRMAGKDRTIEEMTLDRQCVMEFVVRLDEVMEGYDAVLSLGCGAGVQAVADMYPQIPILPALNTQFIGETKAQGLWVESCLGCGDCMLYVFGGICPLARCAKQLFNGPCGGSVQGRCEIDTDVPCAWQAIIDRLRGLQALDRLEEIYPPKDWSKQHGRGPRKIIREDQQK